MKRLPICAFVLLVAGPLSAEWPASPEKKVFLQQLEAVGSGISANNRLLNWVRTQSPPPVQPVNAFSTPAIEAYILHFNALMNLADLYGRFSGPTDRPIFACNPPSPCGPGLEPPLPPRMSVLALAQTLMSEAMVKYSQADVRLAAIESSYSSPNIVEARDRFDAARHAAQTIDWNLNWAIDPRPQDGVLSTPGVTRDTAPAYYPFGTWLGAGREIGQAFNHLSQGWRTMIEATVYEPSSLNQGAFANRHDGALKSLVSALGLMVAVETDQVRPHLEWMTNAAPGVSRQEHRWILAFEILQNIDPGGPLGSGVGGAPRGFDFSGRSFIETASAEYNTRMICYPMVDFLVKRFTFQKDPFANRFLTSFQHNCEANFRLGNAAYRLLKHKHYPPLTETGAPPPNPCSACGPGTTCAGGVCRADAAPNPCSACGSGTTCVGGTCIAGAAACNPYQAVFFPGTDPNKTIVECVEVRQ